MTNTLLGVIGFVIVIAAALLILGLAIWRRKAPPVFRDVPAYDRMKHAVGRVVEDGTRLHVSLGHGALATPQSASGLTGLVLLSRLAELTSAGDQPPIATSGDPGVAILSQDVLQAASKVSAQGVYDPTMGRLTGLTPFSYAAGAITTIHDENISANLFIGNFGVEAGLMIEAAERENTFTLAGSDNLSAQAVMYGTAQEPLIGEELFAAGAYTGAGPLHLSSLTMQDILRWGIIAVILIGSILKVLGIL